MIPELRKDSVPEVHGDPARRARAGAALLDEALHPPPATQDSESDPLAEIASTGAPARDGERIGSYRLTQLIGQGGMGAVYAAARVDGVFDQRVALKLLRSDRTAPQTLERFRRERAILARLQHPNIAGLLDGGITAAGEAWFAMELVDGMPLIDYAQRNTLALGPRLALFRQVCEAVAFAHRNLVVHRDLKPSNIMVDGEGRAKLLDFGIAKLIETELETADRPLTLAEERVLTPDYAAPEQILGQAVTTATDVYALGLLLYELLTGQPAQSLRGLAWVDMSARVCSDESPMPSRASPSAPGRSPSAVKAKDARERRVKAMDGREMSREANAHIPLAVRADLMRGDLDAIVLKALRKEPEQRYTSVLALLDDIECHQRGHPVAARAGGTRYRWSRFLRRNRIAVAAAAAVLLALTLGLGAALWQTRAARLQAQRSDQVRAFLVQMFRGIDQNATAGHEVTARELLDAGAARLTSDLIDQPDVQAELFGTLGGMYIKLGRWQPATEMLTKSLAILRTQPNPNTVVIVRTLLDAADAQGASAHYAETRALLDEARQRLVGDAPAIQALVARVLDMHVTIDALDDDAVKGEQDARALVAFEAQRMGTQSAEYGMALMRLGGALTSRDLFAEAERTIRQGLDLRARVLGANTLRRPDYTRLFTVLQLRGHYREALVEAERLYEASRARNGDLHIETLTGRIQRALLLSQVGRSAEAETELRITLAAMDSNSLGAPSMQPGAYGILGNLLADQGRLDEGGELVLRLFDYTRSTRGPDARATQYIERDLGAIMTARGKLDQADSLLQHAAGVARRHNGEDDLQLAEIRARQSALALARGNAQAAESQARLALPVLERWLDPEHYEIALARHALGRALLAQGNAKDAEAELRVAAERCEAAFTRNDVRTREYSYAWGEALAVLNDPRAEPLLHAAAEELTQDPRYQGAVRARALAWLAKHSAARVAAGALR